SGSKRSTSPRCRSHLCASSASTPSAAASRAISAVSIVAVPAPGAPPPPPVPPPLAKSSSSAKKLRHPRILSRRRPRGGQLLLVLGLCNRQPHRRERRARLVTDDGDAAAQLAERCDIAPLRRRLPLPLA